MQDVSLSAQLDLDAKHAGFSFARYKFVAKMLAGRERVLEVGCGGGPWHRVVAQAVGHLHCTDLDVSNAALVDGVTYSNLDILGDCAASGYDAVYLLDVFEHIADEERLMASLKALAPVCIIGTPSLESQKYAGERSRAYHVNCKSGEDLRALCQQHYRHVFMLCMNDETLHTGFLPMAHYLFAVCVR